MSKSESRHSGSWGARRFYQCMSNLFHWRGGRYSGAKVHLKVLIISLNVTLSYNSN